MIVPVLQANIVLAREVARRYGDKGVIAVSLDPGNSYPVHFMVASADKYFYVSLGGTKTGLQQNMGSWSRSILVRLRSYSSV